MDRTPVILILAIYMVTLSMATPVRRRDIQNEVSSTLDHQQQHSLEDLVIMARQEEDKMMPAKTYQRRNTKDEEDKGDEKSSSSQQHKVEDFVMMAREEKDELMPTNKDVAQGRGEIPEKKIKSIEKSSSSQEHKVEDLVIMTRKEDEVVQTDNNGAHQKPTVIRDEESIVSTPTFVAPSFLMKAEDDTEDGFNDELMDTADSGLVFRPAFRYRSQNRRRLDRNTRRGSRYN